MAEFIVECITCEHMAGDDKDRAICTANECSHKLAKPTLNIAGNNVED